MTGEHPGLASLGIEASNLEQKLFEVVYAPVVAPYEFTPYKGEKIPKVRFVCDMMSCDDVIFVSGR